MPKATSPWSGCAAHLHLSPAYFSTLFKREVGMSFTAYVTVVRMEAAATALRTTEEKTYLIARKCGYDDPNYFSYVFKRHFGVTPTKYRAGRLSAGADDVSERRPPRAWTVSQMVAGIYRRSSIQGILSLSFTAVAVVGMIFMGLALFFRFSANTNAQMAENSQRVLAQVNLNLDAYLRRMMRLSDTAYYSVIKDADLAEEDLSEALDLLYENNRDALVSIALFSEEGDLIASTPLVGLKNSVNPEKESWFTTAMDRIENLHFSTPHVQNLFEDPDYQYRWVVSLSRQVELTRAGSIESGVLLVDMSFGGIEQICKDVDLLLHRLSLSHRRGRGDHLPPPASS